MPYCINCGVELSGNECPLCNTKYDLEKKEEHYPENMDTIPKSNIAKVIFFSVFAIAALCCIVSDFGLDSSIHWSLYVLGAQGCFLLFYVLLPIVKKYPLLFSFANCAGVCLYLLLICALCKNFSWLMYGIALCVLGFAFLYFALKLFASKIALLYKFSVLGILLGIFAFAIDVLVNFLVSCGFGALWSLYVSASLLPVSVALFVIEKNKKVKEKFVRKMFF